MREAETNSPVLPKRPRGRPTAGAEEKYAEAVRRFCDDIQLIASGLDFRVSSRGWCYILEDEYGLPKGDFDAAQRLINECRKTGLLPLSICAEDGARAAEHLEDLDQDDPSEYAANIVDRVRNHHLVYTPKSIWDDLDVYVEMVVEKIDLKSLFSCVCKHYRVPLTNARGWSDLNSRAAIMRRFKEWQDRGKQCVLLFCGDHDPGGLAISDFLRSNFEDLSSAVGWHPHDLIIERFGLNFDFIEQQGLSWIDNLETSGGGQLDDPRHPDHHKSYVQDYLRRVGARKVEANALVVRPEAGRKLCRDAINRYVTEDDALAYETKLDHLREECRQEIEIALRGEAA